MKCRDLQFILPLYSDNVLSEVELSLVENHLDSCPVCRQK
ncbi:MAG: zf-HC2 domain-containing protein, partial [Acidobacteria bacterium]|nr:zf-HC2 domain-containing protein [Acidobacteriota bacterium]